METIGDLVKAGPPLTSSKTEDVWRTAARNANGMDRDTFVALLEGLWAGMGRTKLPDATTVRVWYCCLSDLTPEQMALGIREYLTTRSSEFISVQIIRELSGVQSTRDQAAIDAWDAVAKAVRSVGGYASPQFNDPLIPKVINHIGGWVALCDTKPEEFHKWTRQHFVKAYSALFGKPVEEVSKLENLCEQQNAQTGMIEEQKRRIKLIEHNSRERQAKRIEVAVEPQERVLTGD